MIPSQIVQFARDLSGCRTDEISDSLLFSYMNIEYRKLRQDIADTDKNYKLREWKTNLVAGVSTYELEPVNNVSPQNSGQIKIDSLFIQCDDSQQYPYRATYRDWDNLDASPEWYAKNQNKYEPFYIITDNSVRIFPTPEKSVAQ